MRRFQITVNGTAYTVDVEELAAGATAAPAPVAAPVAAPAPAAAPAAAPAPAAPAGGTKVTSPLPGTVLKVNATVGAAVKSGDLLCTVEAMKMENEILAPCDGTVTAVSAKQGATVNAGDLLICIG